MYFSWTEADVKVQLRTCTEKMWEFDHLIHGKVCYDVGNLCNFEMFGKLWDVWPVSYTWIKIQHLALTWEQTHSHLMVNNDVVSCAYSCSSNQKPVAPLEFSQSSVLFSNSADNATLLGKQWLHKLSKLGAIADVANASNGKMKSSNAPDVNFCDWACAFVSNLPNNDSDWSV